MLSHSKGFCLGEHAYKMCARVLSVLETRVCECECECQCKCVCYVQLVK